MLPMTDLVFSCCISVLIRLYIPRYSFGRVNIPCKDQLGVCWLQMLTRVELLYWWFLNLSIDLADVIKVILRLMTWIMVLDRYLALSLPMRFLKQCLVQNYLSNIVVTIWVMYGIVIVNYIDILVYIIYWPSKFTSPNY